MAPNRWPNDPLPSGVPYSDLPITNSNCMNKSCEAFAAGWNQSEKEIPLMSQIDYSYWTLCYYLFWLVIFIAAHYMHVITDYFTRPRASGSTPRIRWTNKLAARYRSIAYRRFTGRWAKLGMPSLGLFALFALSTIFFTCLVFPEKPYLRSRFRYGSPPLSVRCAMTISALMPLLIALAGKVNIITWLTGASYAELNIFHRYVGGVVFALATIHTVPHIIAPIKDGGYDYFAQLFIWKRRELSGVILYFIFLVMMILSIPAVRRRYYEFFAFTHIILGMAFFGILWWHIKGEYASPIYIYSTVGIFVLSNLVRIAHRNRSFLRGNPFCKCGWNGALGGFPTKIEQLPGKITKLTVDVPAGIRWKPGRHSYIRMPRISIFGNHPFTIASIPSASPSEPNQMVFLIRAHAGFTKSLAERAALHQHPVTATSGQSSTASSTYNIPFLPEKEKHASSLSSDLEAQTLQPLFSPSSSPQRIPSPPRYSPIRTIVDGTYGTYTGPLHRTFDTVVLIAAGTGITAALPHALDLSARMRDAALLPPPDAAATMTMSREACAVRDVRLVWTVRDEAWVGWVRGELERAVANANEGAARARAWRDGGICTAASSRRSSGGGSSTTGVGVDVPGRIVVDVYVTGKRETPASSAMASQTSFAPPATLTSAASGGGGAGTAIYTPPTTTQADFTSTDALLEQLPPPPPPPPPPSSPPLPFFRDAPATRAAQADRSRWSSAETIRISESSAPRASNSSSLYSNLIPDTSAQAAPRSSPSRVLFAGGPCQQCCRHHSRHSHHHHHHHHRSTSALEKTSALNVRYERPVIAELVPALVSPSSPSRRGGRAFVMGCGPEGLKIELGNVVAGLQGRVMEGAMEKVVLHMETFGW